VREKCARFVSKRQFYEEAGPLGRFGIGPQLAAVIEHRLVGERMSVLTSWAARDISSAKDRTALR